MPRKYSGVRGGSLYLRNENFVGCTQTVYFTVRFISAFPFVGARAAYLYMPGYWHRSRYMYDVPIERADVRRLYGDACHARLTDPPQNAFFLGAEGCHGGNIPGLHSGDVAGGRCLS